MGCKSDLPRNRKLQGRLLSARRKVRETGSHASHPPELPPAPSFDLGRHKTFQGIPGRKGGVGVGAGAPRSRGDHARGWLEAEEVGAAPLGRSLLCSQQCLTVDKTQGEAGQR